MVALGHGNGRNLVGSCRPGHIGNQGVDVGGDFRRQFAILAPEIDDGGFLALAPVGEMTITGNQSQQHAQLGAALLAAGRGGQNSFLFMLLLLPLTIPILIFGSAASWANTQPSDGFLLLLSLGCGMIPLGVWLSALLLRHVEI